MLKDTAFQIASYILLIYANADKLDSASPLSPDRYMLYG